MAAARYRVTCPNKEYNGATGDCQFANGRYEGEVAEGTLLYFEQAGYAVEILDGDPEPHAGSAVLQPPAAELKGQTLDDALEAAGLPTSGKADEKRQRLADHQASLQADPLEGDELDAALTAAELDTTGTEDEKRARLAEHNKQNGA